MERQHLLDGKWRLSLLSAVGGALLLLGLFAWLAAQPMRIAQAQTGTLSMAITKTLDGSPVVRVGQYISFTIRITNTGTISITHLPVIDTYDANVLRFDETDPPPSTQSDGLITWTDLPTDAFAGPMEPGAVITIASRFRVIGISDMTINKVRIEDALGWGGQSGGSSDSQSGGKTEGGHVVIEKALVPGQTPVAGQPVTFTVSVRNDGAADLVKVPVQDTFDPAYLAFASAFPPPSKAAAGSLNWDNLLPSLRLTRLHPDEVITITTVFTALQALDGAIVNRASAVGVRDEFQNELPASRQAEVPIRILPGQATSTPIPAETATPRPTSRPHRNTPTPDVITTPTALAPAELLTPTIEVTATVELSPTTEVSATDVLSASLTPTPIIVQPTQLPRTGAADYIMPWLLIACALILLGVLVLFYQRKPDKL